MHLVKSRGPGNDHADQIPYTDTQNLSKNQLRQATTRRLTWATLSSLFLFFTVIFLIVAEVGNTSKSNGSTNIYFLSVRGHPTLVLLSLWSRIRSGALEPVYKTISTLFPGRSIAALRKDFNGFADALEKPMEPIFSLMSDQLGLTKSELVHSLQAGHLRSIGNIPRLALAVSDLFPDKRIPFLDPEIQQTLGLHDFYTVGLWNYCEGYVDQGITGCSRPQASYWFNPVQIIQSQLLAGASIQLPEDITRVLNMIRVASHFMSAFFLIGACLSFILILLKPMMVFSRWTAFSIGLLSFVNAAFLVIASVVATVLFVIMRDVFNDAEQVNINAQIGSAMFAMIWTATVFALLAWIIDLALMCCCASRRDVRSGKKGGSKNAYHAEEAETYELK